MQGNTEINPALVLPLQSFSKAEIDRQTEDWLNSILEVYPPDEVYIHAKQMEAASAFVVDKLKVPAFDAIANRFSGEIKGRILGHDVRLSYPERWKYSVAVDALAKQQKLEMDALKAKEKADGLARKEPGSGVITVVIRGE